MPKRHLVWLVMLSLLGAACGSTGTSQEEAAPTPSETAAPSPEPATPTVPPFETVEPLPERPPAPEPEPEDETVRGAWVHLFDDALKTRAGIAEVVDELAGAHADTIVAQVARRHDAYYASDVLPPTPDPRLEADLDVLDELTRVAHDRGLEVHAWIAAAPTWHHVYDDLPAPPDWLPIEHGLTAPEERRWVTRDVDGTWSEYLDPALPEVGQHLVDVVTEIASEYPVDGIHLDYVRYASERHGYHPVALARYRRETGATATPAPDDPDWSQWRRDRTREVVARVRAGLAEVDPEVTLSAAVIAWGEGPGGGSTTRFEDTRAYGEALQDWPAWARGGLVDAVMPMVYFRDDDTQQRTWFSQWTEFQRDLADEVDALVVPGVGGWLNQPDATLRQTLASSGAGDGAMVYSYQQPTADESREVWSRLAETDWGFDSE